MTERAMPDLSVDPDGAVPPYEQIRLGILDRAARGELLPGDRLPAIRVLAGELGLAAGTVARAYRALEEASVITTRRGAGTRIAEDLNVRALSAGTGVEPEVRRFAAEVVAQARDRGLDPDQLVTAVRDEVAGGAL